MSQANGKARQWVRQNILGLVAIFIALSGSAVAAQVASNDRAQSAKAKKGRPGPPGPAGPAGPQGTPGSQGPVGPSTGPAGGDLAGSFPNPTIGPGTVTPDKIGVVPAVRATEALDPIGPGCFTRFSVVTGVARTLTWEAEDFDSAGTHIAGSLCQDPNRSRLTAPRNGVYLISVGVLWVVNPTGTRYLGINVNGNPVAADEREANAGSGAGSDLQTVTTATVLSQGDNVTSEVNSGTSVSIAGSDPRNFFSLVWLGPAS